MAGCSVSTPRTGFTSGQRLSVQAILLTALGLAFALSPADQRSRLERVVTMSDVLISSYR